MAKNRQPIAKRCKALGIFSGRYGLQQEDHHPQSGQRYAQKAV